MCLQDELGQLWNSVLDGRRSGKNFNEGEGSSLVSNESYLSAMQT